MRMHLSQETAYFAHSLKTPNPGELQIHLLITFTD